MKLVMTLVARDEGDIIDAQIAFHLNAGVDFVVAIDNGSEDDTREILESYARDGYVHMIRDDGEMHQGEWVTRLARLAASDFGANWVINSDVDGFWWPRGGTLKEVLAAVPPRFGAVRAMVRHFAPRLHGEDFFAERMVVRVCNPGAHSNSPYSSRFQTAHRADPEVVVNPGNHHAFGRALLPLPNWYPIDMLHFPIRSLQQCERKLLRWRELNVNAGEDPGPVRAGAYDAHRKGQMLEFYDSHVVDDRALAAGLSNGTLAIDTRVRDALRSLRADQRPAPRQFDLPPDAAPLSFGDTVVDVGYLSELGTLEDALDPLVHAQRKVDTLEARIADLEFGFAERIRRRLATTQDSLTRGARSRQS